METAVLPAQDHLAQERYRHQSRVMSGMIYPLETVSRTRRKVRSPPPPRESIPVSSMSAESARLSFHYNSQAAAVAAAPSNGALAVDMAMGILRSAPVHASIPTHSPSGASRNNQYRSHHGNTAAAQGFISHESAIASQKQQLTASSCSFSTSPESTTTGFNGAAQIVLRTRSEGELPQGRKTQKDIEDRIFSKNLPSKKSGENAPEKHVEKSSDKRKSSERRTVDKKSAANIGNQTEKTITLQKKGSEVERVTERSKVVEAVVDSSALIENVSCGNAAEHMAMEKVVDRPCEKKKASERKVVDKKCTVVGRTNQSDRSSNTHNGQKKNGVITILQRPQTVEAAAENLAKITGRALEACTLQVLNQQKLSPTLEHGLVKPLATTSAKAAPSGTVSQSAEVAAVGIEVEVEALRNGNATTVSPKKAAKKKPSREHIVKAAVPRPATESVHVDVRNTKGVVKHQLRSASAPEGRGVTKREAGNDGGPIRSSSLDQGVSDLINSDPRIPGGASAFATGVPFSLPVESLKGEVGQLRADSHGGAKRSENFREVSRANSDSSVELLAASSPPKSCERWAGPAYTNSPPPSTLPFPTFPIQRVKSSLIAVTLPNIVTAEETITPMKTPTKSSSAPSSPSRASSSSMFPTSALQLISIDPMSATKDLRRILNLEVDGDALGAASKCSEEVSTTIAKREEVEISLTKHEEMGRLTTIMNDLNSLRTRAKLVGEQTADISSGVEIRLSGKIVEHMHRLRDRGFLRDEKGDELFKEWEQADAATRSLKRILQLPN